NMMRQHGPDSENVQNALSYVDFAWQYELKNDLKKNPVNMLVYSFCDIFARTFESVYSKNKGEQSAYTM
ncbi:hypothetical protein PFISCL1PPCAC_28110, partial [Pristionchus fissidentatus]